MAEIEGGRDRDINSGRDTEKGKRRHGVHKTGLPQAPIASQLFLAVLTSQPQISRALTIDRDSGRQDPGSVNQVFSSLPCFKDQYLERKMPG